MIYKHFTDGNGIKRPKCQWGNQSQGGPNIESSKKITFLIFYSFDGLILCKISGDT